MKGIFYFSRSCNYSFPVRSDTNPGGRWKVAMQLGYWISFNPRNEAGQEDDQPPRAHPSNFCFPRFSSSWQMSIAGQAQTLSFSASAGDLTTRTHNVHPLEELRAVQYLCRSSMIEQSTGHRLLLQHGAGSAWWCLRINASCKKPLPSMLQNASRRSCNTRAFCFCSCRSCLAHRYCRCPSNHNLYSLCWDSKYTRMSNYLHSNILSWSIWKPCQL